MKYILTSTLVLTSFFLFAQQKNIAIGKRVTANSENPSFPANNVVDGKISRNSKWMSADVKPPHILEVDFPTYCNISQIVIHTGIPDAERTAAENAKAAGFWSAKNFKLQYWDDANWTDIPNTEVHENRLTTVKFDFSISLNTFRLRLVCDDGEPISITEFEVFGNETSNVAPAFSKVLAKKKIQKEDQNIKLTIEPKIMGKSMKYVGYNQGYFMPNSNASGWLEYSGVNSLRVWTTLNSYAPVNAVQVDPKLTTVTAFDQRKAELRSSPEKNKFIKWDVLLPIYSEPEKTTNTNPMVLSYVLSELKRLKIDPVIQIGNIDYNETWSNKWQQWQRFYALAYYMAKNGEVTMFAMQNEPNHKLSGMNLKQWISGMKIVSDAVHCAIADVNQKYNKKLIARMVGPVTAGNNPEWWAAVMKEIRTDYHGNLTDYDLIEIFSTHSYNSPAAGYINRINDIRKIITENHPKNVALPIVYTEIGRWMNAYLIDKEETMDSPSLFTEWAGIYTNNTKNNAYGMWAFKFSNTASDVYSEGVKSGHHFTWRGKRIVEDAMLNLAANQVVKTYNNTNGLSITDELKNNASSWTSDSSNTEKWIEIQLPSKKEIASSIIYTGSDGGVYTAPDRVKNFRLSYMVDGVWKDIQGAKFKDNKFAQLYIQFKQPVISNRIRFSSDDIGQVKVREIKLFGPNDNPDPLKMNFDISGIQRTGEVVRLFAKGFKNEMPMLVTTPSVQDDDFDSITSFDASNGNYYVWLVQRGNYNDLLEIDLSKLNVNSKSPISAELVNTDHYGEVADIYHTSKEGKLKLVLPKESVMLLTIPSAAMNVQSLTPTADAAVRAGKFSEQNFGRLEQMEVKLNASAIDQNQVSYIQFKGEKLEEAKRAYLKVNGAVNVANANYRIHVYAIPNTDWKEMEMNWKNALELDSKEPLVKNVGLNAFIAGEINFSSNKKTHILDVTDVIKKHGAKSVTFVLVRETRQMGDDEDKNKTLVISSKESSSPPVLEIWK